MVVGEDKWAVVRQYFQILGPVVMRVALLVWDLEWLWWAESHIVPLDKHVIEAKKCIILGFNHWDLGVNLLPQLNLTYPAWHKKEALITYSNTSYREVRILQNSEWNFDI